WAVAILSIAPNAPPNDTSRTENLERLRDHEEKVASPFAAFATA
ncbi:hypothetical protein SAMN05216228_11061, partial [Rhizobium tibeticum]